MVISSFSFVLADEAKIESCGIEEMELLKKTNIDIEKIKINL